MASTQVSQQLSAVAGRTTAPLHPVAKAAQKHLSRVIKAVSKEERQALIRKAAAHQARDTRIPENNKRHGKHIWIYNMRGTNRVIYSLTQELNNHKALSQITFVGKKSVPAVIRPDLWNPFAIVTFPTAAQGLEAYRFLREFRMRHEYEWRQHLADKDDLPEKSLRKKMLQNQKPNTVADLAATLALQQRLGREQFEERLADLKRKEEAYKTTLQKIQEVETELGALKAADSGPDAAASSHLETKLRRLRSPAFAELSKHHEAAERALQLAEQEADGRQLSATADSDGQQSPREAFIQFRQLEILPSALSELRNYPPLPKRGRLRQRMVNELGAWRNHIPTLNGVRVVWADANDRQYAETWPEEVEHEVMGVMNGTAPHPNKLRGLIRESEEAAEILSGFGPREEELLLRTEADWKAGTDDMKKFVRYLQIKRTMALKRSPPVYWKAGAPEDVEPEERAARLEVKATSAALQSVIWKLGKKTGLTDSDQWAKEPVEVREQRALKHVLAAARYRLQAQEALREAHGSTEAVQEGIQRMESAVEEAKTALERIHATRRMQLRKDQLEKRAQQLRAKKSGGANLTPEEEELIQNVELDGESSGKNEEYAEESEKQDREQDEKRKKEKRDKEPEQKKSLWGKLFSGSAPPDPRDGQPRA